MGALESVGEAFSLLATGELGDQKSHHGDTIFSSLQVTSCFT